MQPRIGRMGDPIRAKPGEYELSSAERLLWDNDHLGNIERPMRLYYEFSKSGSLEDGFEDTVKMEVRQIHEDGSKSVQLEFFTGERKQHVTYPDSVERVRGNPVLGFYLQGDVYEMNRLTEGNWRHFQSRIKTALAEAAEMADTKIEYGGSAVAANSVTIRPYLDDPRRARYKEYASKTYEFIFSDRIPGSLYRVHTVINGSNPEDDDPLIVETLTFAGAEDL